MARSVRCGLVLSVVCCCLATSLPVLAQPIVELVNVPQCVLIGEEFTFIAVFRNPGSMGFAPFIDLMTQAGGNDRNTPLPPTPGSPGPCDGITVLSARILSVGVDPALTLAGLSCSCCGVTVPSGSTGNLQPGPMPLTVDPSPDIC
jgi:hypothetical protein